MTTLHDDAAWHEWRRQGIGGSDVAALIGLSRYASPTSLYYEKLGLLDEREEDSPRQRIGKRMETVLAEEFSDRTGLFVVGEQTWCEHTEYPWARCTIDGFAADSPYGSSGADGDLTLGTVEFKTDGRFGWPDGVPANIRAQTVWQMGVTGLRHCWLIVMFAGFRVEVFEIPWDADAFSDWEFMFNTAMPFWYDHVLAQEPPPVDDHEATTDALGQIYRDPAGYLDADDTARALVASVQAAQAGLKAAKAEEDRTKNELRALLGSHTDLVDGWTVKVRAKPKPNVIASWREQTSRRIDTTALRLAEPEVAEKFTTTTTTRVLRVSNTKED